VTNAVVVFTNAGEHPLAPLLKPGFRHCFVVVRDAKGPWILVDPADGVPCLSVIGLEDFDVPGFYRDMGLTVVETAVVSVPFYFPWTIANCVGMVKAVIGLRAPLVVTPYGLYRRLTK
jgi:hypothetical protein